MSATPVNPAQLVNAVQQANKSTNLNTEMELNAEVHTNEASYNRQGLNYVSHQTSNDPMTPDKFQELTEQKSNLSSAVKAQAVSKMV